MNNKILDLLKKGENETTEFKEASFDVPKNVYETVCAFLNTNGGDILLGVSDNTTIKGISKDCIKKIKDNFITASNSSNKINPTVYLDITEIPINEKIILHIQVPNSSQVHRCNGKIFKRLSSADIDITNNNKEVFNLYKQKDSYYSETKIFPAVELDMLNIDLFERVKKSIFSLNPNSVLKDMDNISILKNLCLYRKDAITGEEGFTLACILLFGTDELIGNTLPAFRIDLIKRVNDVERYDDRVDLRTNLIESYDKMLEFIVKHLPDPFHIDENNTTRISLRDIIFREIIANILVHKEYSASEPTRIIIYKDKIVTENSNKPYINGVVDISKLMPHPKNPNIAKVFRLLGRVEELGSGMQKLNKYCKTYTNSKPVIKDENVFKLELKHNFFNDNTIQATTQANKQVTTQATIQAGEQIEKKSNLLKDNTIQATTQTNRQVTNKSLLSAITIIQATTQANRQVTTQATIQAERKVIKTLKIIDFCKEPKSKKEIMNYMEYKNTKHFGLVLKDLVEKNILQLTIPGKPTSPKQKYISVINRGLNDSRNK